MYTENVLLRQRKWRGRRKEKQKKKKAVYTYVFSCHFFIPYCTFCSSLEKECFCHNGMSPIIKTVQNIEITVFCDVAIYDLVERYKCFGRSRSYFDTEDNFRIFFRNFNILLCNCTALLPTVRSSRCGWRNSDFLFRLQSKLIKT
jgi:hypothetical protein